MEEILVVRNLRSSKDPSLDWWKAEVIDIETTERRGVFASAWLHYTNEESYPSSESKVEFVQLEKSLKETTPGLSI